MSYRLWNYAWVLVLATLFVSYQNCSQSPRQTKDSPLDDQVTKLESVNDIDDLSLLSNIEDNIANKPGTDVLREQITSCRGIQETPSRTECVWSVVQRYYSYLQNQKKWTVTLTSDGCIIAVSRLNSSIHEVIKFSSTCRVDRTGELAPHGLHLNSCVTRSSGQNTAVLGHKRGPVFEHLHAIVKYSERGQYEIDLLESRLDSPDFVDACGLSRRADQHRSSLTISII